jgi:hypothetical protein
MSIRLMQTPNNYPFTHGWGVYPELETHTTAQRRAARKILGHVDGSKMVDKNDWQFSMRILEKMFLGVEAENRRDWFTIADRLGQPSRAHAGEIRALLTSMKTLVPSKDAVAVKRFLAELDRLAFMDMLHSYRDATDAEAPADTGMRDGWCNIVWSDLRPNAFLVGVTEGTPFEVLDLLEQDAPGSRYGLLSAWQVDATEEAAAAIERTFGRPAGRHGLLQLGLNETLPQIKLLTENAIWNLIVPSPWHAQPAPEADRDNEPEAHAGPSPR